MSIYEEPFEKSGFWPRPSLRRVVATAVGGAAGVLLTGGLAREKGVSGRALAAVAAGGGLAVAAVANVVLPRRERPVEEVELAEVVPLGPSPVTGPPEAGAPEPEVPPAFEPETGEA